MIRERELKEAAREAAGIAFGREVHEVLTTDVVHAGEQPDGRTVVAVRTFVVLEPVFETTAAEAEPSSPSHAPASVPRRT